MTYRPPGGLALLAAAVVEAARTQGFRLMRLDTSRRLTGAIALCRSFGFRDCPPYRSCSPRLQPHLLFMELPLDGGQ